MWSRRRIPCGTSRRERTQTNDLREERDIPQYPTFLLNR
jgi:hypothetical protein